MGVTDSGLTGMCVVASVSVSLNHTGTPGFVFGVSNTPGFASGTPGFASGSPEFASGVLVSLCPGGSICRCDFLWVPIRATFTPADCGVLQVAIV